jgi:hypothetical protein
VSPGLHVVRTARGYCWEGSAADWGRSDARRCFIGNFIHDPWFSDSSTTTNGYVVCAATPWSRKVVKIALTRKLPLAQRNPSGSPLRRRPWAIKLSSAQKCVAFTGATGTIAGRAVAYGCVPRGYLLGEPRRTGATWTIWYAAGYKARHISRATIAEAWW